MKKMQWMKTVSAVLMVSALLAGCGGTNTAQNAADSGAASTQEAQETSETQDEGEVQGEARDNADTVTITDVRGEVEIPAVPERLVDLSGNSDILSILGYRVIGTANSDAYDYTKFPAYLEDTLAGATILGYSMQDTMDVENILSLDPDMIIISTVQEKMYDQLSAVAPTVMIENAQINWEEDVMAMAEIFGKTAEATAWLEAYHAEASETGAAIREAWGEDTSYLSFLASGGQLYIFDAAGFGSVLYDDMGLNKPEGMPEQENISLPVVTYEGLAAIDADVIFAIGTEEDMTQLKDNAIWQSLPAVVNGQVVELPSSPYFNEGYSCIGRSLLLTEIPEMLDALGE